MDATKNHQCHQPKPAKTKNSQIQRVEDSTHQIGKKNKNGFPIVVVLLIEQNLP
jgi:hypothetical protein